MRLSDTLDSTWWYFSSHPLRTAAVIASLGLGISAVTFSTALVEGFATQLDRLSFGDYGRALIVRANPYAGEASGTPTMADLAALRKGPSVEEAVGWRVEAGETLMANKRLNYEIFGVVGDFLREADAPLLTPIFPQSKFDGGRGCVLGGELAAKIQVIQGHLPEKLKINGVSCDIVGVLGPVNSLPAQRYAEGVFMSLSTANRFYFIDSDRQEGDLDWITVFTRSNDDMVGQRMKTDLLLRRLHGIPQSQPAPFQIDDPTARLRATLAQAALVQRLSYTLAAIALVMSVTAFCFVNVQSTVARNREFAIRLAVGGSPREIVAQAIFENLIVGLVSGVGGVALGLCFGLAAQATWSWPFALNVEISASAVALGITCGLVSGGLIARIAGATEPAAAART